MNKIMDNKQEVAYTEKRTTVKIKSTTPDSSLRQTVVKYARSVTTPNVPPINYTLVCSNY